MATQQTQQQFDTAQAQTQIDAALDRIGNVKANPEQVTSAIAEAKTEIKNILAGKGSSAADQAEKDKAERAKREKEQEHTGRGR